jgi:hypothetical protein
MNRSKEVEAWLEAYDNPMNEVVRRVREIILHSDHRIEESIEGEAPTFSYRGNLASFFPHSKKHASLMVPEGAKIPGHHPRLEGTEDTGRVMKIGGVSEANAAKDDLQHLVRTWCDWRDAESAESEEQKAPPVKKPAKAAAKRATKKGRKAPAKKGRKPAAKSTRRTAAKKTRSPAAKKPTTTATKKARRPASKKGRRS